jgi:hypothetical protein
VCLLIVVRANCMSAEGSGSVIGGIRQMAEHRDINKKSERAEQWLHRVYTPRLRIDFSTNRIAVGPDSTTRVERKARF